MVLTVRHGIVVNSCGTLSNILNLIRTFFLACGEENRETLEPSGGSLLTQWMAKYGYVPIVLIGVAGLALEIGTGGMAGRRDRL